GTCRSSGSPSCDSQQCTRVELVTDSHAPVSRRSDPVCGPSHRSGRYGDKAVRLPLALIRPSATAVCHDSRPVATATHVNGSVSTTFGGVPRVWRGPATHWTAPYGGTRTSTDRPGAAVLSARNRSRTAVASAAGSG